MAYNMRRSFELSKLVLFAACGSAGGVIGAILGEVTNQSGSGTLVTTLFSTSCWSGLIAVGIASALATGQSYYLSRSFPQFRQLAIMAAGAGLAGVIAGFGAQLFFGLASALLPLESIGALLLLEGIRIVAWTMMGAALGMGLAICIPNLKFVRGFLGGGFGAAIGGFGFLVFAYTAGDMFGRWLGAGIIGGCIGTVLAWIETAFREAWLELQYGPNEIRTVSLGKRPVTLGSDRDRCTVYVAGTPSVVFKYAMDGGLVYLEDLIRGQTMAVRPGDRRMLGNVAVTVRAIIDRTPVPSRCAASEPPRPPVMQRNELNSAASGMGNRVAVSRPEPVPAHPATPVSQIDTRPATGFFLTSSGGRIMPLAEGTCFTAHQLGVRRGVHSDEPCAEVVRNPSQPGVFGLKNLTNQQWQAVLANGDTREIDPGKSIRLAKGTRVTMEGVIVTIE